MWKRRSAMSIASLWRVRAAKAKAQTARRSFVPRLMPLEDRTLPSTFTVLNLNDSGAGSLRQAVLLSNLSPGADTINFAAGLTGTIALTSGQLNILGSLAVNGPGADKITVSGSNASRVFAVAGPINVTISGLTVAQGKATQGGGLFNLGGNLSLSNMVVAGNPAQGSSGGNGLGGGAYSLGGALTITGSTFSNNQALGGNGGGRAQGGAIFVSAGKLALSSSSVSGNK